MINRNIKVVLLVFTMFVAGSITLFGSVPVYSQPPIAGPDDPVTIALAHLRAVAAGLTLRDDLSDLQLKGVVSSLSSDHVRFQQTVQGIPVYGAEVTVHVDKRRQLQPTVRSSYRPGAVLTTTAPAQDAASAIAAAANQVGVQGKMRKQPEAQLVAYPKGAEVRLAWQVLLAAQQPLGDWEVLVDAATGAILESANRIRMDSLHPRP